MATKTIRSKSNGNGNKASPGQVVRANLEQVRLMNDLVDRLGLASRLGVQRGGKRDMYKTFGWLKNPKFEEYQAFYERDGLAGRIVDEIAGETWRRMPVIVDGQARSDAPEQTGFTPFLTDLDEVVKKLSLWEAMENLDVNCGMSQYTILFFGTANTPDYTKALEKDASLSIDDLIYVKTLDEGQLNISQWNEDPNSPDYGMPLMYAIKMFNDATTTLAKGISVHASRVVHVAEGRRRSRVFGRPRLQRILNALFDVEKVLGGGSEAFWLNIYRGFAISTKDGFALPDKDSSAYSDMEDEIEAYMNDLRRYMMLKGFDVKDLGAQPVDASNQFKAIVSFISGATGIPQRILIGSERGELASSQDDINYADFISRRQTKFAAPVILRPVVQWLIDHGVVSAPQNSMGFGIEWPSLFSMNELEEAQIAMDYGRALYYMSGGAPDQIVPFDWAAKTYFGYVAPDESGPITNRSKRKKKGAKHGKKM